MPLDRIIGVSLIENKPDVAAFLGFIFVLVGFIVSYLVFSSGMSVAMIGFSSVIILPYVLKILKYDKSEYKSVFHRDSNLLKFYMWLFFGMAFAYTLLFGVMSPAIVENAFSTQLAVISGAPIGGEFVLSGQQTALFNQIVVNNLLIVIIVIVLSIIIGPGAWIFILNYNASIAGIVYGSSINTLIWRSVSLFPLAPVYLPHTILEILAYLLAALAGSILAKPMTVSNIRKIKKDALILIICAVVLIFVGGYVEVTLPFLFFEIF